MIKFDPQTLIVVAIVAGAAVYLIRRQVRSWRGKKAACGGCGTCSAGEGSPNVVSIEPLNRSKS